LYIYAAIVIFLFGKVNKNILHLIAKKGYLRNTMSENSQIKLNIAQLDMIARQDIIPPPVSGKPLNVKAAFATWYKEIRDAHNDRCRDGDNVYVIDGKLYGHNSQGQYFCQEHIITGKMRGQMKYWLWDRLEDGYNEELIRGLIQVIIRTWYTLPYRYRTLHDGSQKGRPYRVTIPPEPDFSFFFAHRSILISWFCEWEKEQEQKQQRKKRAGSGKNTLGILTLSIWNL
jgi:hypothetical protein